MNPTWVWLVLPVLLVGLCVVFQILPEDLPWSLAGCVLGYAAVLARSTVAGSGIGTLMGAASVGVFANLWAEKTGRPVFIVLLPAIIVLVNGSIGFRGIFAAVAGDTVAGTGNFVEMFLVVLAVTAGLVVANTIAPPKRAL